MSRLSILGALLLLAPLVNAMALAGVTLPDQISIENDEALTLNSAGVREKFWIDIYVGSLYQAKTSNNLAEIFSTPNAFRIQMDFVHKEVASNKLIKAWNEGFESNQSSETLNALQARIAQFNANFKQNAVATDQFILDYIPGIGTNVRKNNKILGRIPRKDFKNALLEIWLGNFPADKKTKPRYARLEVKISALDDSKIASAR